MEVMEDKVVTHLLVLDAMVGVEEEVGVLVAQEDSSA